MTDDELHEMWTAGASLTTIAAKYRTTKDTVNGRITRLRRREGLERWPYHPPVIKPRTGPPPLKRAPAATLPPLASLRNVS